jgi:hypothetical protein
MLCRRTILPSLLLVALSAHPLSAHPMIQAAVQGVYPAVPWEILQPLTPWRVTGGRLALHVYPDVLASAGLQLRDVVETAGVPDPLVEEAEGAALGFAVTPESDLLVLRNGDGVYQPYGVLGGAVRMRGGFTLVSPATVRAVDFHAFEVHARWVRTDGPGGDPDRDVFYLSEAGGAVGGHGPDDAFRLCYPKVYFAAPDSYPPGGGSGGGGSGHNALELRIRGWDLIVTTSLAERLGRPELEGLVLGYGRILTSLRVHDGPWEHPPGQNIFSPYVSSPDDNEDPEDTAAVGTGTIDMQLGGLQSLVVLGHDGDLPTGRTGLSLTTISCNVGDVNIPWLAAMETGHPGIGMALYRELDGRFEQVGVSWIKHGFFAQSNSSCTPCQTPGGGLALGVGCSDTYGSANNGDRFWLGPRSEWNPYTATWECLGSFFDGTPVDCVRNENGTTDSDVDHRLEAFDEDLALPGATYWYEAFYMVTDDVDPSNNIASRRTVITVDDDGYFTTTPGVSQGNPVVLGPAIQRWGQKRTLAGLAPDDGDVILAAQVTPEPGGLWRYEYALFNWTLDRKVDSFSIPLSAGFASGATFHDVDDRPANDWVPTQQDGNFAWTFPGVVLPGHKVAGPLEFGTLYNFGFTSDRPPAVRNAVLGIHERGPGGDLLVVETLAPDVLSLTADEAAPLAGGAVQLRVQGGVFGAVVAALSVGGTPLASPLLITPSPVLFGGGDALVDVPVPAALSGMDVTLIAVEVDAGLAVVGLSNVMNLSVR